MLTVRNLPPGPNLRDWARQNTRLLIAFVVLTTTLLSIASARPGLIASACLLLPLCRNGLRRDNNLVLSGFVAASEQYEDNLTAL